MGTLPNTLVRAHVEPSLTRSLSVTTIFKVMVCRTTFFVLIIWIDSASRPVVCPRLVTTRIFPALSCFPSVTAHWYYPSRFLSLVECEFLTLHLLRIAFVTYSSSYPNFLVQGCVSLPQQSHGFYATIERQRLHVPNRRLLFRVRNLHQLLL